MVVLREVRKRSQMTGNPEIDLSRTAFNPLLLLTENDWNFVQEATGLSVSHDNDEPEPSVDVVDMAAKVVFTVMERRLAEFINKRASTTVDVLPPTKPVVSKAKHSDGAHVRREQSTGGQFRVVQGSRWYDGPELPFSTQGLVVDTAYHLTLAADVDSALFVQVLRLRTLTACLVLDTLDASFTNFAGLRSGGNWKLRCMTPGQAIPNIAIEMHNLDFKVI